MAKKRKRKYSRGAGSDVKNEMHRYKRGTAKSGKGGKGGRGEKPQAGHRHRPLQGAQKRQEGSEKEIAVRAEVQRTNLKEDPCDCAGNRARFGSLASRTERSLAP